MIGGIAENDAPFIQEGKETSDGGNISAQSPKSEGSVVFCFAFPEETKEGENMLFGNGPDIFNALFP